MPSLIESTLRDTLSRIGSVVKRERQHRGFSQEELAHRSGLHRTYITDIERGARNITIQSISKLSRALDVPLTRIFAEIEKPAAGRGGRARVPGSPEGRGGSPAVNILLVEDNPKHAELTRYALEKHGVSNRLFVVGSGEEGLDFLSGRSKNSAQGVSARPELILLDLKLPGLGGLEVLRRIRATPAIESIPVVILTSSRSDQDLKECLKLGITAYINKPVDFVEFSTVMPKLGFRWMLTA